MLSFTTEGFEQLDNSSNGGSKRGDSEEEKKKEAIPEEDPDNEGKRIRDNQKVVERIRIRDNLP